MTSFSNPLTAEMPLRVISYTPIAGMSAQFKILYDNYKLALQLSNSGEAQVARQKLNFNKEMFGLQCLMPGTPMSGINWAVTPKTAPLVVPSTITNTQSIFEQQMTLALNEMAEQKAAAEQAADHAADLVLDNEELQAAYDDSEQQWRCQWDQMVADAANLGELTESYWQGQFNQAYLQLQQDLFQQQQQHNNNQEQASPSQSPSPSLPSPVLHNHYQNFSSPQAQPAVPRARSPSRSPSRAGAPSPPSSPPHSRPQGRSSRGIKPSTAVKGSRIGKKKQKPAASTTSTTTATATTIGKTRKVATKWRLSPTRLAAELNALMLAGEPTTPPASPIAPAASPITPPPPPPSSPTTLPSRPAFSSFVPAPPSPERPFSTVAALPEQKQEQSAGASAGASPAPSSSSLSSVGSRSPSLSPSPTMASPTRGTIARRRAESVALERMGRLVLTVEGEGEGEMELDEDQVKGKKDRKGKGKERAV